MAIRRATLTLVVAGCLAAACAAAAATGVLSVGNVIPGGDATPESPLRLPVDETVLATGKAPLAGPWVATAHLSEESPGQPAGLPCLRLVLTEPPPDTFAGGAGFCGDVADGFAAVSVPVATRGRAEVLIFGLAPERAAVIELAHDGGRLAAVSTRDGGSGFERGDVFVIAVPEGTERGELRALDDAGKPTSGKVDTSGFFDQLRTAERIARSR